MVAAPGGYQAETTYYINGLDVEEKAEMMRNQLHNIFQGHNFSKLSIKLYGTATKNPRSQAAGTCFLRVFAQARRKDDIAADKFKIPIYSLRMQSYPGYHMNLDFRTMDPKPFMEIFPAVMPLSSINHHVIVNDRTISINPPQKTGEYPVQRPSYETDDPVSLETYGPTRRAALGSIVHARSGDKGERERTSVTI